VHGYFLPGWILGLGKNYPVPDKTLQGKEDGKKLIVKNHAISVGSFHDFPPARTLLKEKGKTYHTEKEGKK